MNRRSLLVFWTIFRSASEPTSFSTLILNPLQLGDLAPCKHLAARGSRKESHPMHCPLLSAVLCHVIPTSSSAPSSIPSRPLSQRTSCKWARPWRRRDPSVSNLPENRWCENRFIASMKIGRRWEVYWITTAEMKGRLIWADGIHNAADLKAGVFSLLSLELGQPIFTYHHVRLYRNIAYRGRRQSFVFSQRSFRRGEVLHDDDSLEAFIMNIEES